MADLRKKTGVLVPFLLLAWSLFATPGLTEQFRREYSPFLVTQGGVELSIPFLGGINDPKPTLLDLDGDGRLELFYGERTGKLAHLTNVGTVGSPIWKPVTDRFAGLDIGTWYSFCDIDDDGDYDFFCDNRLSGCAYYQNTGSNQQPDFVLADTTFGGQGVDEFTTEVNNTPKFADLDGDNDFDFFYGNPSGYLWFYQNTGTPQSPAFVFESDAYDSVYAFIGGALALGTQEPHHGFSNISFVDMDADADLDLFWGDIFNFDAYLFRNLGTPSVSALTLESEEYFGVTTAGYNHLTFGDLDGDSDFDVLLGAAIYANINNFMRFENVGTAQLPQFVERTRNYLENIDVAEVSHPSLGDIDGDGDTDLLVGAIDGTIRLFTNVGTPTRPHLQFTDSAFSDIDVGVTASPELIDIDSDMDLDLFIGTGRGRVQYWRNEGTPTSMQLVKVLDSLPGIKADQNCVPAFGDMNGDGTIDLVIGEWDFNSKATIRIYENIGVTTLPEYSLVVDNAIPVATREWTIPTLRDWDGDNQVDLLLGNRSNGITFYRNTAAPGQFPDSFLFVPSVDTIPGHDEGWSLAMEFADIDSDGDDDLFVGEEDGGISFFRSLGCCDGITGDINGDGNPNPTIADLTYLVTFLFNSGPQPSCLTEGNINGAGTPNKPTIGDLTYLVAYLFLSGQLPAACQ